MGRRAATTDLDDRTLKSLAKKPPPDKRVVKWDSIQSHFGLRITENGAMSFVVVKRMKGVTTPVVRVLGSYPGMALADARKQARKVLEQIGDGIDPKKLEKAKREEAARKGKDTFAAVAGDFIAKHVSQKRSAKEATRVINLYLVSTFGPRQIGEITRDDVNTLLDDIEAGKFKTKDGRKLGGPVMADHVLAALRKLMNWHATKRSTFNSPIVVGMARTSPKKRARKRILTDDEIRALWAVLDEWDIEATKAARKAGQKGEAADVFGALVRNLLVTAQRREEVAGMKHAELEGPLWTIPADRHKTGEEAGAKLVPLPKTALATIAKVPKVDGSDLVFTTNGEEPFSGFSKAKRQLDAAMLEKLRAVFIDRKNNVMLAKLNELPKLWEAAANGDKAARAKLKTAWWTLHDLRRTGKTLMGKGKVPANISERVLGHVIKGVEGTYDLYEYLDEKREAVEQLERQILLIVDPPSGDNVVPMKRRKRA
jgi:integrase